jgi:hypothetical protein
VAGAVLALSACGQPAETSDDGARGGVVSSVERGPVAMTVRAEPDEITVGERVTLTVEVTAPDGVDVRMP